MDSFVRPCCARLEPKLEGRRVPPLPMPRPNEPARLSDPPTPWLILEDLETEPRAEDEWARFAVPDATLPRAPDACAPDEPAVSSPPAEV
jgi:hypothetical protein